MIYDIIVCGGGHSGCEAAWSASKFKSLNVLLLTNDIDNIAHMNCNPSIGGKAKSQLVHEINALGGLMGLAADFSGIHFKNLNYSRGESVQCLRIQCDKYLYKNFIKNKLETLDNITIIQGTLLNILCESNKIKGVLTNVGIFEGKVIILTTGTFLRSNVYIGKQNNIGSKFFLNSSSLTLNLYKFGIKSYRFKTGTPPRISKTGINFFKCLLQETDRNYTFNSYLRGMDLKKRNLKNCWVTNTNLTTNSLIYENLNEISTYNKKIISKGPRYCPSIEDKLIRFPLKNKHRIFLEPESSEETEWYINGISSALSLNIQSKLLKSIVGLENCRLTRSGFLIEYDYMPPTQLKYSLESKYLENLFFAGQINGTTGYEEAACQGLIAGINGALKIFNAKPLVLKRNESYIGLLINDLVGQCINEPYRMFTCRSEHKMLLNGESSYFRLIKYSKKFSLLNCKAIKKVENDNKVIQHGFYFCKKYNMRVVNKYFKLSNFITNNINYKLKYDSYLSREQNVILKLNLSKFNLNMNDTSYLKLKNIKLENLNKTVLNRPKSIKDLLNLNFNNITDVKIFISNLKR